MKAALSVRKERNRMKIKREILWNNRSGKGISWFHPRCCPLGNGRIFMSLQSISGSDFYGAINESFFDGEHWSEPVKIPGLGQQLCQEDISESICDVVPYHHEPTDTVLAIGHNVYYRNGALFDTLGDWGARPGVKLSRFPVWSVRNAAGEWGPVRQKLIVPGLENATMYSCGSSQWFFKGRDQVYIPLTYGEAGRRDRMVCSARFTYDGKNLVFEERGNTLELPVDRGLLEPSITEFGGRSLMTIRAEDGHGYWSESSDGIHWKPVKAWSFDNGEMLEMSSTQQHFLVCGGKFYLVYTRNVGYNAHVMRFRAPLFIAEINEDLELIRESEEIVFPMIDEGENAPGMGNFQAVPVSGNEAVVTVGEERGYDGYRGNTLLAKITF